MNLSVLRPDSALPIIDSELRGRTGWDHLQRVVKLLIPFTPLALEILKLTVITTAELPGDCA